MPENVHGAVQLGDLGVGFDQDTKWHVDLDKKLLFHNTKWIRGNHDNPSVCKHMASYIEDGMCIDNSMFIGGAWSIDQQYRSPFVDWWPDEEVSHKDLILIYNSYSFIRPTIMFTHDCPLSVSKQLFVDTGKALGTKQYKTRTGSALQAMFEQHQPKVWFFGHWHHTVDQVINGTRFICLGELDYVDFDVTTLKLVGEE